MADATELVQVKVDGGKTYQTIDGFGVNINSKYWAKGGLAPVLKLLIHDLGATLYRVDIFGKSNWVDPLGEKGPDALKEAELSRIYRGEVAQNGFGMMRYLNQQGIQPYLTCSGDVPAWMLAPDGKTLAQTGAFCDMLVSLVEWARKREGLQFRYFGPMNETDLGSPEGPSVSPQAYAETLELLDEKLASHGLDDVQFVAAEQSAFNADYVNEFTHHPRLKGRIGVVGMHTYSNTPAENYRHIAGAVHAGAIKGARLWLSEYGDLEQSGEKEWYVAWVMTARLMEALAGGFHGALVWDAFDNYHDHDEAWTIYGLLRTGLRTYTPKKRYHACKQFFRYILPGFHRVAVSSGNPSLQLLGFASPDRERFTLAGMNVSGKPIYANVKFSGFSTALDGARAAYYRTSESENFARVAETAVHGAGYPFDGLEALIPPYSIVTLTTAD